ncbi:16S rRNA (cytidine1402-2'-O)-methyltransferase [Pedobacter sp. UYP30]|uniref:SAM-dependent methyltransferase n=1 Tax=Pedobacter sp. UYP30 TaxID=1756400 RepID=UPI0033936FF5
MANGTLFLIPVPLAEEAAHKTFTPYLVDTINQIDTYIVESSKTARKFLKEAGLTIPQKDLIVHDYGKHNRSDLKQFFTELKAGKNVGLMSEAGCPGVADPGAEIVAEAHRRGIKVVPLVGPCSILLALMGSGFNGQSFAFWGYLPIDKEQRAKRIKDLDLSASRYKQTQIFIETPFRNNPLLVEVLNSCKPDTKLCIACSLTGEDEFIKTQSIASWRKEEIDLHKKPCIFLLQ